MMALATLVLADISLGSLVWWLVVGLIAGFLASVVMRGGGYGIVGDIVVGIVGAIIGGFLASLLGISAGGFIGTIIIAFIGACILIAILRAVSGGYGRRVV
ncbi:MAG: GlsB/YeaQ/YmgE family stress response membrane protein [Ktedonobacteraceae bacterium]|nr:GlsB/YeaQ/YmgE family stress response membrane protein [Ktedonobacteraceae bacterium]MBV8821407.1 GlsB/YeaQ/YmgE family stress response membrane protein [Ktedonobacteraceae bacterium]MBV9019171.1 GlsB/YeaQ/YmgE family stress response membrane protein [Ktedonobacteraceae bacterium]